MIIALSLLNGREGMEKEGERGFLKGNEQRRRDEAEEETIAIAIEQ